LNFLLEKDWEFQIALYTVRETCSKDLSLFFQLSLIEHPTSDRWSGFLKFASQVNVSRRLVATPWVHCIIIMQWET